MHPYHADGAVEEADEEPTYSLRCVSKPMTDPHPRVDQSQNKARNDGLFEKNAEGRDTPQYRSTAFQRVRVRSLRGCPVLRRTPRRASSGDERRRRYGGGRDFVVDVDIDGICMRGQRPKAMCPIQGSIDPFLAHDAVRPAQNCAKRGSRG